MFKRWPRRSAAYGLLACAVTILLPIAAMAAPVTLTPKSLTMETTHFGKITATTTGATVSVHSSTCFPISGNISQRDILKAVSLDKSNGKLTLSVRAQKAGRCEIIFASGNDTATLRVTVEESE